MYFTESEQQSHLSYVYKLYCIVAWIGLIISVIHCKFVIFLQSFKLVAAKGLTELCKDPEGLTKVFLNYSLLLVFNFWFMV